MISFTSLLRQRPALLACAAALAASAPASVAWAQGAEPVMSAIDETMMAAFEADRADILAMAGDYKVRFDMQESTAWVEGYEPLDRKISGGHESVRIIEDTGTKIVLQHLLVVETPDGENFIVKHWRQDWEYQPEAMLVYSDTGEWSNEAISEEDRKGKWSQTVYQVDDSPRYAGIGEWKEEAGVRRWASNWTWRPQARRDAIRETPYDRYVGINRHSQMPGGWIHFQDNTKMGMVDGELKPIVQEYVLNTYTKFDDYDTAAADDYWKSTADYWEVVRAEWDKLLSNKGKIAVTEYGPTGTVISGELLEMGTKIHKGEMETAAAIIRAKELIGSDTLRLAAAKPIEEKASN
ncbi:DUF6607 family protein [Alterisphingorhabdus coralli]|uniref:DUF6607 family protein n=1 Tax=Alterisphingorhabdus coralli TaxID=3071408 RepID=A0AA97I1D0_9SPHN|nr:DUF6607 family protein [Parasphingorhabdus sp. SCSIO 66989]WOE75932.1 DUF6607 family protein [Parasphingorhabdus sp. SCSIO 66989]